MKRKNIIIIVSLFAVSVMIMAVFSGCSIGRFAFNPMRSISQGMRFKGNPDFKEKRDLIEKGDGYNEFDFRDMPCNPENKNFKNKKQYSNGDLENIPFMGIEMAQSQNGTTGVLVNSVISGSPAEKAGIKAQDVITAADGQEVKDPSDLLQAVLGHKIGETIKVTINRSGQSQELSVTLDSISNVLPDSLNNGQGTGKEQKSLNDSEKSSQTDSKTY